MTHPGGRPQPKNDTESGKLTSSWTDSGSSAPKLNVNSTYSAGARTHARIPTPGSGPALQLDKGKGKASEEPSSSAPREDRGKAKEVTPGNPFSPSSNAPRLSLEEEILNPTAAAAAQRRREALAGMGGSYGSGNNSDLMSSLLGMGGRTLGGASGPNRPGNEDPLIGLLGMGGRPLGGHMRPSNNNDPLSGLLGVGGMGAHTMGTPSFPPPAGLNGRPLGSPIQQTDWALPPSGRAGGGRMSGLTGLESLLGGLGGLGPGGGHGGMGGGVFDPGMFGPEAFGPGSNRNRDDGGSIIGTGSEGGGDDVPRSGTWSGIGIQSRLSDDGA